MENTKFNLNKVFNMIELYFLYYQEHIMLLVLASIQILVQL